jgi:two-component system NarL family response regulator
VISVLVVDDHQVFAQAVAARLSSEEDIEIAGTAGTVDTARRLARETRPDVVIVDATLEIDLDGITLVNDVLAAAEARAAVVVSGNDDPRVATSAIRAGARAFVLKGGTVDELVCATRGAARGESWVTPRVLTGVLRQLVDADAQRAEVRELLGELTRREQEVLQYLVDGLDRGAIANTMFMSLNTVRTHTHHIFRKLGVHSTIEAVALALRAGWTPRGGPS